MLSAGRDGVVGRAGRSCWPGGTVLSAGRDGVVGPVENTSDTYYVTVGTILLNLGVPSKLIGCIPKVADRYKLIISPDDYHNLLKLIILLAFD